MSDFETMPVGTRKALGDAAELLRALAVIDIDRSDRADVRNMADHLEHLLAEVPHG